MRRWCAPASARSASSETTCGASRSRRWRPPSSASGCGPPTKTSPSAREFRCQRNLRVEHLRDRAARLGLLGDFLERAVVDVRHPCDADEIAVRDREAVAYLLEAHRGGGLDR